MAKIGIVVVAYNAAATLATVLDRIPDDFVERIDGILVCDNASDDPTYLVGLGYQHARERPLPLTVIRQERNLGYGGNQKTGYRWAIEQGYDIAVLLHADGQYAPEMLPEIVAPLEAGQADAVFGSRMMVQGDARRGGMPMYKYVGNKILSTFENRIVGTDLTEWHSGYRAYSVAALKDIPFEQNSDEYDFDTGIILQMHDAGKRILEIPIPTFYGDEISYVNGMRYAKDIVGDVLRYRFAKLGVTSSADDAGSPSVAPELAEGLGARVAAWLSGRSTGRVLVVSPSDVLAGSVDPLIERGHEVVAVALDKLDDPWPAVQEALGGEDDGGFDAIAACSLLERLPDPAEALRELSRHLRPGGTIVLSVANIGHWYPRAMFASGHFGYGGHGVFAEQNLRFFTQRSLMDLFKRSGLQAQRWEGRGLTSAAPAPPPGKWSARADVVGLTLAPRLFTANWLVEVAPIMA